MKNQRKGKGLTSLFFAVTLALYGCANQAEFAKTDTINEISNSDVKLNLSNDASDFVLLSEAVPDAILEIRYYSTYNFVGTRIDGYEEPVALLTKEAATGTTLKRISRTKLGNIQIPLPPLCLLFYT